MLKGITPPNIVPTFSQPNNSTFTAVTNINTYTNEANESASVCAEPKQIDEQQAFPMMSYQTV